jgi:hypothetical protein
VSGLSGAVTYIKEWALDLWRSFAEFWGISGETSKKMEDGAMSLVNGLIWALMYFPNLALGIFTAAWDGIKSIFGWEGAAEAGSDIIGGILSGLGDLASLLTAPFTAAWSGIKGVFGIASPSTEAAEMADQITAGMVDGLDAIPEKMFSVFKKGLDIVLELFGMEGLQPIVDNVFNIMKDVAMSIIEPFNRIQGILMDILIQPFVVAFDVIRSLFTDGIGAAVGTLVDGIKGQFENIVNLVKTNGELLFNFITWPWRMAVEMIYEFLPGKMKDVIDYMKDIVGEGIHRLANIFHEMGGKLIGPLMAVFENVQQFIVDVFSGKSIKESFRAMAQNVKISVMEMVDVFMSFLPKIIDVVSQTFEKVWNLIQSVISFEKFGDQLKGVIDAVMAFGEKIIYVLWYPWIKAYDMIADIFGLRSFTQIMADVKEALFRGVDTLVNILTSPFGTALDQIKSIFGLDAMKNIGASIISGFMSAVGDLPAMLLEVGKEALAALMNPFSGSPVDSPDAPAGQLGAGLAAGITSGISDLPAELKAAGGGAMKALEEGMGATGTGNEAMIQAVIGPVSDAINVVQEAQNNIHEILNNLAPIDLDATMSRTAEELAVKNKTVQIQHKPVKITVNLNVTMAAEDIATALVEGKYVAQGDNATPPGQ